MAQAMHNDQYATKDQLNFDDYRQIIGDIIRNTQTPLTIGIFGPWGSGKTSLLRMLEEDALPRVLCLHTGLVHRLEICEGRCTLARPPAACN